MQLEEKILVGPVEVWLLWDSEQPLTGPASEAGWMLGSAESLGSPLRKPVMQTSGFPAVLAPAASASPGNLLERQTLGPHPRPVELETLGVGPRNLL